MTTHLSKETYEKLVGKSIDIKTNKYKNQKIEYDGMIFDSKKEMSYWIKFKLMKKSGEIQNLRRQVEYILIDNFVLNDKKYRKTSYIADFVYEQDGETHVIDVKGVRTEVYKLKKKIMAYKYGIEIEEL